MPRARTLFVAFLAVVVLAAGDTSLGAPARPACAKGRGTEGQRAALPTGWAAFTGGRGVLWAPLQQGQAVVIPGTENDRVSELEISDDGLWVLYVSRADGAGGAGGARPGRLVLVRRDGTGYLKFRPGGFDEEDISGGACCGFFRNSPLADPAKGLYEIWYLSTLQCMRAALVDLSGPQPVIGKDRPIIRLDPQQRATLGGSVNGDLGYSVSGGHVWGNRMMYTIPNGGRGVGTNALMADGYSGCGHAMSHDGDLAIQNMPADRKMSTELDRRAGGFLPQGHAGFIMGHFYEQPAPRKSISQFFVDEGACIACAPVQEQEFHDYNFTNNKEYLICRKTTKGGNGANQSAFNGIWVVHWPSNTWTSIVRDPVTKYWHPAAYVEAAGKAPARQGLARPAPPAPAAKTPAASGTPTEPAATGTIVVQARLVGKNKPAGLQDLTYRNAYVIYEYEVVEVTKGTLALNRIVVLHWHWRDRKLVTASDKTLGEVYALELQPAAAHKEFEAEQLANEMPDLYIQEVGAAYADVSTLVYK